MQGFAIKGSDWKCFPQVEIQPRGLSQRAARGSVDPKRRTLSSTTSRGHNVEGGVFVGIAVWTGRLGGIA